MPCLIRHPVSFWIALKLHFVPRLRGNGKRGVFTRWINKLFLILVFFFKTVCVKSSMQKALVALCLLLKAQSKAFPY
jgi:hypothetical protein